MRLTKNKINTPNVRRAFIFSAQKCDIKLGIQFEQIQTDRYTTNRRLLITPTLPTAGQKLQERLRDIRNFIVICFLFFQRFLPENLKIFCDTLVGRHRYMCIDVSCFVQCTINTQQLSVQVIRQTVLQLCAMYNKHTAAVSTGHKADCASALCNVQ